MTIFSNCCRFLHRRNAKKAKKSDVQIMDLPEEIWLLIFENLDTAELRNNVRLVCRDWCRVVADACLYTHPVIDFRISKLEIEFILRKYHKSITCIDIRHRQKVVPLLELITKCENLQILIFDYCFKCESKYH